MALEEVTRIDLNSSEIEPIVSCVVDETNNVLYSLCALNTGWRTMLFIVHSFILDYRIHHMKEKL
jgi:hypothetical protein